MAGVVEMAENTARNAGFARARFSGSSRFMQYSSHESVGTSFDQQQQQHFRQQHHYDSGFPSGRTSRAVLYAGAAQQDNFDRDGTPSGTRRDQAAAWSLAPSPSAETDVVLPHAMNGGGILHASSGGPYSDHPSRSEALQQHTAVPLDKGGAFSVAGHFMAFPAQSSSRRRPSGNVERMQEQQQQQQQPRQSQKPSQLQHHHSPYSGVDVSGLHQREQQFPTAAAESSPNVPIFRSGQIGIRAEQGGGAGRTQVLSNNTHLPGSGNGSEQHSPQHGHYRCSCSSNSNIASRPTVIAGRDEGLYEVKYNAKKSLQGDTRVTAVPCVSLSGDGGAYGGGDTFEGKFLQQHQVPRHGHRQNLSAGQDNTGYGERWGEQSDVKRQLTLHTRVERLDAAAALKGRSDVESDLQHCTKGLNHLRVRNPPAPSAFAPPDTTAGQSSHIPPYPIDSDGFGEREKVALTGKSPALDMAGSTTCSRRRDSSHSSSSHSSSHSKSHEVYINGRWHVIDVVDPATGGGGYQSVNATPQQKQQLQQRHGEMGRSSVTVNTSTCRGYNVTRRAAPSHHQHRHQHIHQQQCDRRTLQSASGVNGDIGVFNAGATSRVIVKSPPLPTRERQQHSHPGMTSSPGVSAFGRPAASSLSPPERSVSKGTRTMMDPGGVVDRKSTPEASLAAPKNPLEWLQSLRQARAGGSGKERSTATPRTSRSSSASSMSSPSRLVALAGIGELRGHEGMMDCPAPDCPGRGDCLVGATPDMLVYEVRFKRATRTFLPSDILGVKVLSPGDRMKVEADRGEDLGTIHRSLPLSEYLHTLYEEKKAKAAKIAENGGGGGESGEGGGSEGKKKRGKSKKNDEDGVKSASKQQQQKKQEEAHEEICPVKAIKRILRHATPKELERLEVKAQEEAQILGMCQTKVRNRSLPMKIVDAEYQFDEHKLTLFFEAEKRIDFRELVRDLFAVYKTRIWMQQVKDKDTQASSSSTDRMTPYSDAAGNGSNDGRQAIPGVGSPIAFPFSFPAQALAPADDADHDSGYGSCGSVDRPRYGGTGGGGSVHAANGESTDSFGGNSGGVCFDSRVGGVSVGQGLSTGIDDGSSRTRGGAFGISWPGEIGVSKGGPGGDLIAPFGGAGRSRTVPFPIMLKGFDFSP